MSANILILDDERPIADLIELYLKNENYNVYKFHTARQALACVADTPIDLAILDVMLPDEDGFSVCRKIREEHYFPVIMLTAKVEDMDKIMGLTLGADDYITKPFNPLEVMARVKSQLRRYTSLGGADKGPGLLTVGPITMDDGAKRVTVDGEPVALTPIEYNILLLLMKNPGRVFSTGQIYELVWNDPSLGSENTVAVHIRHLREKIEIDPADPRYLKVVWGLGYKLEEGVR